MTGKLGLASTFFNKIKIFCQLTIIDNFLPAIIGIFFIQLFRDELEYRFRKLIKHITRFFIGDYLKEWCADPFDTGEVEV